MTLSPRKMQPEQDSPAKTFQPSALRLFFWGGAGHHRDDGSPTRALYRVVSDAWWFTVQESLWRMGNV